MRLDPSLEPSFPEEGAAFGYSVAVEDDWILVGAPRDYDRSGTRSGAVYAFQRVGSRWIERDKLTPWDGENHDWFGHSVAIEQRNAVIGAPYHAVDGEDDAGAAYVAYDYGYHWGLIHQLTADDPQEDDYLGYAVAMDLSRAVVGAPGADPVGAAYVFRGAATSWVIEIVLQSDDKYFEQNPNRPLGYGTQFSIFEFGKAVAIDGDRVVVGAPMSFLGYFWRGAGFVYDYDNHTWHETFFVSEDGHYQDYFGVAVGASGSQFFFGAPGYEWPAKDRGTVFVGRMALP